jgi:hypothetical protein
MKNKDFKDLLKSINEMKDIKLGKIKIRRTWIRNPATKIKPSDKIYNRKKFKLVKEIE